RSGFLLPPIQHTVCAPPSWRQIGSGTSGDRRYRGRSRSAYPPVQMIQVSAKDQRALPGHPQPAVSWHSGVRGGAMLDVRLREVITRLGGAAAAWPLAARAQQPGKLPTIGFLGPNTRSAASEWVVALVQRLRELGWMEGRNITLEYRWAEGREERFPEIAAELVRLKVELIVTSGTQAVMASKKATSVIPIVFATAGDPVGSGLVASLARPGGNVTGLATLANELAGKRLELLREVVPGLRRLAIMGNVGNPFTVLE